MNELLLITVPAAITSFITFFFTRKQTKASVAQTTAEVESKEIENVEKVARIWRELSEDLREKLSSEIGQLRKENLQMKTDFNTVQEQFIKVLSENNELKSQMTSLEKQLRDSKCQTKLLTDQNKNLLTELKKFNRSYEESEKK